MAQIGMQSAMPFYIVFLFLSFLVVKDHMLMSTQRLTCSYEDLNLRPLVLTALGILEGPCHPFDGGPISNTAQSDASRSRQHIHNRGRACTVQSRAGPGLHSEPRFQSMPQDLHLVRIAKALFCLLTEQRCPARTPLYCHSYALHSPAK